MVGGARVRAIVVTLAVVTACGVPTDDEAVRVPPGEVPFGLADSSPSAPAPTEPSSEISVDLFYVRGDRLVPVSGRTSAPVTPRGAIDALLVSVPPTTDLRSVLAPDDIIDVAVVGGVATVDLDQTLLELPTSEQVLAVAQIVLTLTGLVEVDAASFSTDGEPVAVPLPDGSIVSDPVGGAEYVALLE